MIASHLCGAAVTEETLLQRKRDQENLAAQDLQVMPAKPVKQLDFQVMENAIWGNLELKFFGELQ